MVSIYTMLLEQSCFSMVLYSQYIKLPHQRYYFSTAPKTLLSKKEWFPITKHLSKGNFVWDYFGLGIQLSLIIIE